MLRATSGLSPRRGIILLNMVLSRRLMTSWEASRTEPFATFRWSREGPNTISRSARTFSNYFFSSRLSFLLCKSFRHTEQFLTSFVELSRLVFTLSKWLSRVLLLLSSAIQFSQISAPSVRPRRANQSYLNLPCASQWITRNPITQKFYSYIHSSISRDYPS